MKVLISRDGEHLLNAEVDGIGAIPDLAFAVSQHHGSGEYIIRNSQENEMFPANEPLFRMYTEWLEGDER